MDSEKPPSERTPNEGGGAWASQGQKQGQPGQSQSGSQGLGPGKTNVDEGPLPQVASGELEPQYAGEDEEPGQTYTVEEGDTLQTIAARFYGSATEWERVYHANEDRLSGNPELVYPGQELRIPTPSS